MMTVEQVLDTAMQLPLDQREMLIDILRYRDIEMRRQEIADNARASLAEYRAGHFKPQSVHEVIRELHQALDETD